MLYKVVAGLVYARDDHNPAWETPTSIICNIQKPTFWVEAFSVDEARNIAHRVLGADEVSNYDRAYDVIDVVPEDDALPRM